MDVDIEDYQQLDIMDHPAFNQNKKNPNRLYLSWKNSKKSECKMIGPETKCFCNHRFKEHQHLNPTGKKTTCKAKGCKCRDFQYIPTHGSYDFKCLCKHSYKQHDRHKKTCNRQKCNKCQGFASTWTCSCGQKYGQHITQSQTFDQRKRSGKSVNDMSRMAQELHNGIKQGSLYKPIKQDRQARFQRQIKKIQYLTSVIDNQQIKRKSLQINQESLYQDNQIEDYQIRL